MERRFRVRLDELRNDAEVPPNLLRGVVPRLESFLRPFADLLRSAQQRTNTRHYVQGLLSDLGGKDVESIAYLHDRDRQGLQKFIGQADWDHRPLVGELVRQIGGELGEADGVLVFDPSAFPKKGTASVGVQRQWCGRRGKIDSCQVGIYLGYVSRREHALADVRLYLPKEWMTRKRRCRKAGVPTAVRFHTRHELALEMLDGSGPALPHAWVSGDDELGRCSWFRRELQSRGECYLLAVPSNTSVRDLAAPDPPYPGCGRPPLPPFGRADRWSAAVPSGAWQTVEVRDGEKGPVVVQAARTLVQARADNRASEVAEVLVVFRERQGDGTWKHDYLLSNAPVTTSLAEFGRVFKAQHRIEECLKRAKGEAGLADYQVRTWEGWHHHQTLSLIATWFLTREARRGKKVDAGADGTAGAGDDRHAAEPRAEVPPAGASLPHREPAAEAQRGGASLPLAETQPLAASTA
ncbi:MAG TPA: IS701 family transposase [Gemmataceae bacterium]|nr:IS701 family transposase [Gemmataceae bacterium]